MNRSNKPADNHATSKQVFCWRGGCLSGLTFLDSSVALKAWLCRDNGLAKEDTEILSQKGKFARFGFDRLLEGKFQTEIEIFSQLFYNDNSPNWKCWWKAMTFNQPTTHPTTHYPKGLSGKGHLGKLSKTTNSTRSGSSRVTPTSPPTSLVVATLFTLFVAFCVVWDSKLLSRRIFESNKNGPLDKKNFGTWQACSTWHDLLHLLSSHWSPTDL